jgi:hypothetical protein
VSRDISSPAIISVKRNANKCHIRPHIMQATVRWTLVITRDMKLKKRLSCEEGRPQGLQVGMGKKQGGVRRLMLKSGLSDLTADAVGGAGVFSDARLRRFDSGLLDLIRLRRRKI